MLQSFSQRAVHIFPPFAFAELKHEEHLHCPKWTELNGTELGPLTNCQLIDDYSDKNY